MLTPRVYRAAPPLAASLTLATVAAGEPVAESLAPGIVRMFADEAARDAARPSVCLERPWPGQGPAPASFPLAAEFHELPGRHGVRIRVAADVSLYGTGEVSGPLLRNGRNIIAWNTDAYAWDTESPSLYQSHPWVLGVRPDASAFGVLFDTPYRTQIDLTDGITAAAEGDPFPVILIDAPDVAGVLKRLAELTGYPPLPPRWALGYHQCRYSYYPDTRVLEVARGFRDRDIPCTVIWMDIDYMDGFRSFTFDPERFADPARLNAELQELGFESVWMIDPGIKKEKGNAVFESGTEIDAWVKSHAGVPFVGDVWPGPCVFPDFTNARVREWWGDLYADFMATGIDGVWNDMNEPAVFHVPEHTMPLDNWHDADPEIGGLDLHKRYHNIYGMQMSRATYDGILKHRPDKRPFVLTRASHLGGHRWAATWTGDNVANWSHLAMSIPSVLNLGLSGQPFAGPDIGGFKGNGDAALFARWMGLGAMLPFARGHTEKGSVDKEPWSYGPETEATCRRALKRRARLVPYLYTLFREAATEGMPVARPAFLADPTNPSLRAVDHAFLLGEDLLVVARTTPKGQASCEPRGRWVSVDLGVDDAKDADLPELKLRGGAILPLGPARSFVQTGPETELELLVALDENGRAEGTLYDDAGDGWDFRDGAFALTHLKARREGDTLVVEMSRADGHLELPERSVAVRIVAAPNDPSPLPATIDLRPGR